MKTKIFLALICLGTLAMGQALGPWPNKRVTANNMTGVAGGDFPPGNLITDLYAWSVVTTNTTAVPTPYTFERVRSWLMTLTNLGIYNQTEGQTFIGSENNQTVNNPEGFGRIWDWPFSPSLSGAATSSSAGGLYFASGASLYFPTPTALKGSGAVTFFVIDDIPSFTGYADALSCDQGDSSGGMDISHYSGLACQAYVHFGSATGATVLQSSVGQVLTNRPVAYFGIYDGGTGGYLRVIDLTGTTDVTTTGVVHTGVTPFASPQVGIHYRQDTGAATMPDTIIYQQITTGSMSVGTENALIASYKANLGAYYTQNSLSITGSLSVSGNLSVTGTISGNGSGITNISPDFSGLVSGSSSTALTLTGTLNALNAIQNFSIAVPGANVGDLVEVSTTDAASTSIAGPNAIGVLNSGTATIQYIDESGSIGAFTVHPYVRTKFR